MSNPSAPKFIFRAIQGFNQRRGEIRGAILYGLALLLLAQLVSGCITGPPVEPSPTTNNTSTEASNTNTPVASSTQESRPTNTVAVTQSPTKTAASTSTQPPQDWAGVVAFLGIENPPSGLTPPNFDLFVKFPDGNIIKVTENAAVTGFSWSPDAESIVFSAVIDFSSYNLYVFNIANNTIAKLDLGLEFDAAEIEPEWSPDGQRIAFVQFLAGISTIYTYDFGDQSLEMIVEGAAPSWSPSGDSILFIKREAGSFFGPLAQFTFSNGQVSDLLNGVFVSKAIWSASGQNLTFVGHSQDLEAGVYLATFDDTNVLFISKSILPPSWIPGKDEVLFSKPVTGMPHKSNLFVFDLNQNSIQPLDWIPGSFFVYLAIPQP